MKIALAHDWLNQMGGAENVLECLVSLYPTAPVYTTIYAPMLMPSAYQKWTIRTTWLNSAPRIHRHHQPYLPFYPLAVQSMDFSGYDVILSNKSGFIHGLHHTADQPHICYCLSPTRYVWDYDSYAAREGFGKWLKVLTTPVLEWLRQWDYDAAQRVNYFIAISREIQARIKRYYQRDSDIIYPPVDTTRFRPVDHPDADFYLIVSRLIPYKRIDLAVQACTRLKKRLIVVGDGRERASLERIAGPTVEFKGRLPSTQVAEFMANCKAFIFPGFEDFGIAPVEAQAAGRPVIAFAKGGALDTVVEHQTGQFFHTQTIDDLCTTIEQFERQTFDSIRIRENAERFAVDRFQRELVSFIANVMGR